MTPITIEPDHADDTLLFSTAGSDDEGDEHGALLTAEEEQRLARMIAAAKHIPESSFAASLDHALFLEFLRCQAQAARDRLVRQNLRLVYREVLRYRGSWVDLADLVQEGCIGLIEAAERFDPDRGVRFSTYAVPWIRQAVDRAAQRHQRVVRIPRRVAKKPADDVDGAPRLDLLPPASLDEPGAGTERLADSLPDPTADPERDAINAVLIQSLASALNRCPEREREVIVRRYGLGGCSPQSLEAIASALGVCRERVRQLEAAALRRLRLSEGLTEPRE
ncbi:MAG: sigma-70 family RNA polymerase sigma factor [Chloroflexota bacterium]|nr:sigma-70 family RNA polymerase sigma factor [Dehalococcoidia bacterium]MDW8253373.1 sigma-70 family RNA polymerase sigma factor [Chloroflexota bacterium]